ncbi:MAG: glutaminyl-peptide cyclotransferase [Acidobacteria bacterium]|nr:glutaminyl-peptide cyclotransferase [Acidobacteriota bacterium]
MFSCSGNSGTKLSTTTPEASPPVVAAAPKVFGFKIVKEYKHDKGAFTQGLVYYNGFLYESTGQHGESSLRKVELESGKVLQKHDVPENYFAEGMTILNNKIYQLTWQSSLGFIYDIDNFKMLKEFRYSGEGWGLTNDGKSLILSDGTHVIRFLNPETFAVERTIVVMNDDGNPLMRINELEYIKGEIWANIWQSEMIGKPNVIARINPANGQLLGWIDLDKISPSDSGPRYENSLNGIAYDEKGDRIFVTGKNWSKLFEIKVEPK